MSVFGLLGSVGAAQEQERRVQCSDMSGAVEIEIKFGGDEAKSICWKVSRSTPEVSYPIVQATLGPVLYPDMPSQEPNGWPIGSY